MPEASPRRAVVVGSEEAPGRAVDADLDQPDVQGAVRVFGDRLDCPRGRQMQGGERPSAVCRTVELVEIPRVCQPGRRVRP